MIAQSIVGTSQGRQPHDFYPTPREATESLLSVETFVGNVWEPACGDGAISKVLAERGIDVVSTDLIDRGYGKSPVDFLLCDESRLADNVITNPPYTLAEEFVRKALSVSSRKVALLLKLAFLEGVSRKPLFETTPLASVHVFSRRLTMTRNGELRTGGGMIAFAWFVWDHSHHGRPLINWIDTKSKLLEAK